MGFIRICSFMYKMYFDRVHPLLPFLVPFPAPIDPLPLPNSSLTYFHIFLFILMTQWISLELLTGVTKIDRNTSLWA